MMTILNSQDDWVTSQTIVKRIYGDNVRERSHDNFRAKIASKPDFPKSSKFGGTEVWNWGEISDYLRKQREVQKVGRPREK